MTKVNLYDAVEICLQALENGGDVESCLAQFPGLTDELRPILTVAVQARTITVTEVPGAAIRRGRSRVLQAAAEMREKTSVSPATLPFWRFSKKNILGARFYRLAATTAAMLVFLLTGGTGLVNASSNALPGDQLYPVKRSWEGVQLFFVFDSQAKVELEHEFDHERVQEIEELYSEKRVAQVDFQGEVESRNNDYWIIGGLNVAIDHETNLGGDIFPGTTVQVIGETEDGVIKAERIILIATPGVTPVAEPDPSATFGATPQFEASRTPSPTDGNDNNEQEFKDGSNVPNATKQPDDGHESNPTDSHSSAEESNDSRTTDPTKSHTNDEHKSSPTESHSPEPHPTED